MKRYLTILTVVLVAVGLALSACSKKKETTTTTEGTAEPAKAADTTKTVDLGKMVADASKGVDVSGAPDYMKKSIETIKDVNKLIKDNMTDCAKAVDVVNKYVQAHQADLDAMSKAADEATAKMSDDEKMKMGQQMMALMGPNMQDIMATQMEFSQKCASEAGKINEVMKKIGPKK